MVDQLPPSPSGQITHDQVRLKVNELVDAANIAQASIQAIAVGYLWSDNTDPTDPGPDTIKGNNADETLITEIYTSGENESVVMSLVSGDLLTLTQVGSENIAFYSFTGDPVDNGGWYTFPVEYKEGSGGFVDGVAISVNTFQFGERNTTGTKSLVVVNGDDDLPDLTGGYSILEENTEYFFQNKITLTKPLQIDSEGITLSGTSTFSDAITYTGTLPFITSINVSWELRDLAIFSNTASEILNLTGTTLNTFLCSQLNLIGSSKLGTIDGISPVFQNFVGRFITDGFTFASSAGVIRGITFDRAFMVSANLPGVKLFDFADAVFADFNMNTVIMDTDPGVNIPFCFSSSVGGSGNIAPTIEAVVRDCTFGFTQPMIALDGFTDGFQTNQFNFMGNSPILAVEDTKYEADQYLLSQNTIVIAVTGDWYEIGTPAVGAFQSDIAKHFTTTDNDGTWTYTGDKPIDVDIEYICTVDNQGFGQDRIWGRIAINWTGSPSDSGVEKSNGATENTAPTQITMKAKLTIVPGDNGRPIFSNQDDTSNLDIVSVNMLISESK